MTDLSQSIITGPEVINSPGMIEIVWDATMLDAYMKCPLYYHYRFNLNRVPTEPNSGLVKGTIIHHAKEAYFKELQRTGDWHQAVELAIRAVRFHSTCADYNLSILDVEHLVRTVTEESEKNRDEDCQFEIIRVETPFMYELYKDGRIRISMIGKIDLQFNYRSYRNCPLDHKSFEADFGQRRRGNQFPNYAIACDNAFVWVNRVGLQTTVKPEDKFKRLIFSYDAEYKERWKRNVVKFSYDYLFNEEEKDWPMNLTSCDKYGSKRKPGCDYYDVCEQSSEEDAELKLLTFFKEAPKWDVSQALVTP